VTLWVQHVNARFVTTCRTDSVGSISILPRIKYSIPSLLYIDKRDVVVLLWKKQLRQSFSGRTCPTSLCTARRTDSAGSISTLPAIQYSIPSLLYIDKRDVVVLLWKKQLRRSFSDRTRPTSLFTTCRTDSAGSLSTLPPVQYSIPSLLYIDNRDVVVVLWKSQLRRSFGDFMGPTRPCTLLHNMLNRLCWLNFDSTTRPILDSVPPLYR
jgi:hypothetical protein